MDNREEIINEILELTNELTVEEVRTFIKMFEESKKRRGRNGQPSPYMGDAGTVAPPVLLNSNT